MKIHHAILLLFFFVNSFSVKLVSQEILEKDVEIIYKELKQDSVYTKFVGFDVIRRTDDEYYFMYRDLRKDSSLFVFPNYYGTESEKEKLNNDPFFKQNPNALIQYEIIKKHHIRAVLTYNYDSKLNQLLRSKTEGYNFIDYELVFLLNDNSLITHVNFNPQEYCKIKKIKYPNIEKLDSNWFFIKR